MNRLRQEREGHGWSRSELARRAVLNAVSVSTIESGRLLPYPVQLEKLAIALGWQGDPAALLEEVEA